MSSQLERKKLLAQQARVVASRMEMEVKFEELAEAQERVQREIEIQKKAEAELADKLSKLEE